MCEGIAAELTGIDLGDVRLNRRSQTLIETLAADPAASINAACGGWGDTMAAYRFFDNASVTPEQILEPHREATRQRIAEHPVVLVVQDTTELDFTAHPQKDAGCLNTEKRFGFYDHTHLAVTPDRLCLGVVGTEQYSRTPESLGKTVERKSLPIEQKESMRWLTGYRLAAQLSAECPDTQIVSVSDSEADIYDIFLEAAAHETPADFVIRGKEDRSTLERDPESGPAVYRKVRDEVRASDVRTRRSIDLPRTPKREPRTAELEVRAIQVTIKPPHMRSSLPSVTCNIVLVEEIDGPGDGTDVSWLLITTLPIDTVEDVLRVIDYYVARWTIEIYFRILKTGCRVEELQLETGHRIQNCLMLYKIIAWRVLWLTYLNRACPSLRCDVVFSESEWKSVWTITQKSSPPKTPPPLSQFVALLAGLGGHNNRATEPAPGPQPIWIGIRRMTDFALAWDTFQNASNTTYV